MLLHIPNVLTHDELRQVRQLLAEAPWEDGLATAGAQSALVKHNLQLAQTSPQAQALGSLVLAALNRNALFFSAALPNRIFPPMFNCYQGGMTFGNHVDNAVRNDPLKHRTRLVGIEQHRRFVD
jgi:PKHD-type hydroxylase